MSRLVFNLYPTMPDGLETLIVAFNNHRTRLETPTVRPNFHCTGYAMLASSTFMITINPRVKSAWRLQCRFVWLLQPLRSPPRRLGRIGSNVPLPSSWVGKRSEDDEGKGVI